MTQKQIKQWVEIDWEKVQGNTYEIVVLLIFNLSHTLTCYCSEIVHTFNQNYQACSTFCHLLAKLAKQCVDFIKNNLFLVLF